MTQQKDANLTEEAIRRFFIDKMNTQFWMQNVDLCPI